MIKNDKKCKHCGAKPELLTCEDCGVSAKITDCGHFPQPRPLAADDTGHVLCDECYEARQLDEAEAEEEAEAEAEADAQIARLVLAGAWPRHEGMSARLREAIMGAHAAGEPLTDVDAEHIARVACRVERDGEHREYETGPAERREREGWQELAGEMAQADPLGWLEMARCRAHSIEADRRAAARDVDDQEWRAWQGVAVAAACGDAGLRVEYRMAARRAAEFSARRARKGNGPFSMIRAAREAATIACEAVNRMDAGVSAPGDWLYTDCLRAGGE